MREEMLKAKVNKAKVWLMWIGLRLGAWCAWRSNRRAKQRGEKRILEGPAKDPYETWAEYRKRVWPPAA